LFIFTWMDYLKKNIHEKTIGLHAWIIDYIYINDISICHFLFIYVKVMYICVVCTYKYNIILYYIILYIVIL
jgi:hypothetical protein